MMGANPFAHLHYFYFFFPISILHYFALFLGVSLTSAIISIPMVGFNADANAILALSEWTAALTLSIFFCGKRSNKH